MYVSPDEPAHPCSLIGRRNSLTESMRTLASILYKSIAGRYRPVRVADGPITARCRFIKNATWDVLYRRTVMAVWTCKLSLVLKSLDTLSREVNLSKLFFPPLQKVFS